MGLLQSLAGTRPAFLDPAYGHAVPVVDILGVRMECLTFPQVHAAFDWWRGDKSRPALRVPLLNAAGSVAALRRPDVMGCYQKADIRFIDSMPFTALARRATGLPVDRMYGPDVFTEVCRHAAEKPRRFFLVGGVPGAAETMARFAEETYPGVQVVGIACPPFRPLTAEEDQELVDTINAAAPDFVWVGLGAPKQDLWIEEHHERLRGCVLVGIGAAFDFFSGRIPQAPRWIQRSGFEWLYRLSKDFRRLWRRYILDNVVFLAHFAMQLLTGRPPRAARAYAGVPPPSPPDAQPAID